MVKKREYPQLVFSRMTRFKHMDGGYYLNHDMECIMVRNNTRIYFDDSQYLLGAVIMTNPGSYGLDKMAGWEQFKSGKGEETFLDGYGYADPTMQNIIWTIKEAFAAFDKVPFGYVNIYNISSVVCPNSEKADEYHNMVSGFINDSKKERDLIEDPILTTKKDFFQICEDAPFLMMGFVKGIFESKVRSLLEMAKNTSNIIVSNDKKGCPSHPRRWRTEPELRKKTIQELIKLIDSGII